jgi:hypothetical protein
MADSKEPVKRRAPVRNRFPTEADWKLKTLEGRARLTISRLMVLRKERIWVAVRSGDVGGGYWERVEAPKL